MGISDTLTSLRNILLGLDNAQAMGLLIELQEQTYSILIKNRELQLKLSEIERLDDVSYRLIFKHNAYFLGLDDCPYCPRCWDADKKLIHLTTTERSSSKSENMMCPHCKSYYHV